ncbi:hypothetical protein J5T34_06020 [Cupriavidus gilardii]|uniref:gp53-like domain-containing protein n=1 Tax=Cupriavidus gilardii TaxID=82541 RepID=UPI001ABE1D9D|nr:hypothetical protein [Cupriavidus gilardii]MBO4120296.1 hypothetical protein [Cupriavidus gilardii]
MDRQIVYPGQIPLETDLLHTNKFAMVALAKLAAAMLGTTTVVNGLACVPTDPASMQVTVNPGEMYALMSIDASGYSSLPADTAHNILKQGISLDAVTLDCPAPATAGHSVNYLVQAAYQDADTDLVTLPYYNASNPTQAWSGPNNSGTPQATARKGIIAISAKAGVSAPTGTQLTPAPDVGYTGLWVVTVANGQTSIASSNISRAANAPILPTDLLHSVQQSALITAEDVGAANAYAVTYAPAITTLTDGMVLRFKVKTANTGAATLNVNGLGAQPLVGYAHGALQGGELVAGGRAAAVWRADISSWVLLESSGGAQQVAVGTQSGHAIQLGQFTGANQSFGSAGYQKLPGGLILQWGQTGAVSGVGNTTFPIAFPNATYCIIPGETVAGGSTPNVWAVQGITLTGFTAIVTNLSGAPVTDGGLYFALGR